ncbi:MAG: hypothetical protein ACJ764_11570 [Solirubrobacteraceae bacterium]
MLAVLTPRPANAARPDPFWAPVNIRVATAADRPALERLAELDSATAPAGETVIGELNDHVVAAAELGGGQTLADPFVAAGQIVELVRLRAEQLRQRPRHRPLRHIRPRQ